MGGYGVVSVFDLVRGIGDLNSYMVCVLSVYYADQVRVFCVLSV